MTALLDVPGSGWSSRRVAIPTVLNGLQLPPVDARVHSIGGPTMGTTWSARYVAAAGVDPTVVQGAVEQTLQGVIDEMSTWVETSALSRFNRTADEWCDLPSGLAAVLGCALEVARASGGAYDPTIGPLVDLWGFGPRGPCVAPPTGAEIDRARAHGGWSRIEFDLAGRRAWQPGKVSLDLSAIAKGFAVDALARDLEAHGIVSYLVEIGGELRGRGLKPDAQPWWVAIERPSDLDAESEGAIAADLLVALHELSVATSGDYRKRFRHEGRWYAHTIDPRTGRPVTHALASATVVHRECMMADALSTALMVLGVEGGLRFAAGRRIAALFVERTASGLAAHASPALEAMLQ